MPTTGDDIEAEHKAAIDSLTREQHHALSRLQRATQLSHFNHHRIVENLQHLFDEEADARNGAGAKI